MTGSTRGGTFGGKAPGFRDPIQRPDSEEQRQAWQKANRAWWEGNPMRYDWREALGSDRATLNFFQEIDARFLSSVQRFMPWRAVPFDPLISFEQLREEDVLEIGVGHGPMAQILAPRAKTYTGIDLTNEASEMTRQRLELQNLPSSIFRMDAEEMKFEDESFDFIWSWGVIHHSADTARILREMHRVLRPGGHSTVMVYYRSWWSYYLFAVARLLLQGKFPTRDGIALVRQQATDGAIARYYTRAEWRELTSPLFEATTSVYGMSIELIPLPHGPLKDFLLRILPDSIARFMTHNLAMGSFLVAKMTRK